MCIRWSYRPLTAPHTAVLDVAVTVTDVDESGTGSEETTDRPHGLTATVSENAITLTWHEPDNFYGPDYHILRHRPEEGEPKPLVYVDFTETDAPTFTDTDVEPGVLYVYQVRATIDVFSSLSEPLRPVGGQDAGRVGRRHPSGIQHPGHRRAHDSRYRPSGEDVDG